MEEKGIIVTIESNEEEKDPPIFVKEIKPEEEMEEDIEPVRDPAKQPQYVPPGKRKAKVPKYSDIVDNTHITLSLLKGVLFEGMETYYEI